MSTTFWAECQTDGCEFRRECDSVSFAEEVADKHLDEFPKHAVELWRVTNGIDYSLGVMNDGPFDPVDRVQRAEIDLADDAHRRDVMFGAGSDDADWYDGDDDSGRYDDDEPDIDDSTPPDFGPPGSGAVIVEYEVGTYDEPW